MPDLYDQIAKGSYGRTSNRWYTEPDFEDILPETDEDDFDGESDFSALDEFDGAIDE